MLRRRVAPLILALSVACAGELAVAPAYAQGPSPAELKKARGQFQRGIELEQASNWSEALQQFRDVGAVRMTPQVRFHIAYCEEGLGRLVTALGGYELAQNEADQVGADFKSEVESAIGNLRARIPKLVIERGAGADAAAVQLDGVELGATSVGVEVPLDPGPHAVTATAPGYVAFNQTVELKEREVTRVTLELQPETTPAPETPNQPPQVVVVAPPPAPNRTVPYVVGGVGIAALASAGVLFALRQATAAELEKDCPDKNACPESNRPTYNRWKAYNAATWITASVGIAAVGTAVVMILTEKKPKPKNPAAGLSITPDVPNALAGVSLNYRF